MAERVTSGKWFAISVAGISVDQTRRMISHRLGSPRVFSIVSIAYMLAVPYVSNN